MLSYLRSALVHLLDRSSFEPISSLEVCIIIQIPEHEDNIGYLGDTGCIKGSQGVFRGYRVYLVIHRAYSGVTGCIWGIQGVFRGHRVYSGVHRVYLGDTGCVL